ncbi:hypothetical protein IV203_026468 [Nitzschia inconspicua]|uniref:Uncharacterized protein n=1 Tax=Nitzschia inconspicua TaxID=303405 RepID=A0A9K3LK64_9STRA|nr:hypothetical protein IV203_026468 [Nitzschia inconspicua]
MSHQEEDVTGFEDEPLDDGGVVQSGGPAFQFEGVDSALAKAERRRERRRKRNERTGKIAVAVFCVCLIIALILAFEVFKVAEKTVHDAFTLETESPTAAPTPLPTVFKSPAPTLPPKPTLAVVTPSPTMKRTAAPTESPSAAPTITAQPSFALESTYEMDVVEDTYLFLDGQNTGRIYGGAETLLVQHGTKLSTKPGQMPDIPTSYIILKFELSKIENFPDRSRWTEDMQVNLLLTNVPNDDVEDFVEVTLDVYRIPNNYEASIESWTGVSFTSAPVSSREGVLVGKQTFKPTIEMVTVDVTSIFRLSEEQSSSGHYTDDQILLKLVINDGKPLEGLLFRSRESNIPSGPRMQFVMN